jgi:CrcB protein
MSLLLIGMGGALGALSRYYLDSVVTRLFGTTVLGIFFVNITGSFLFGVFISATETHITWQHNARLFASIGFFGSYTTFSTLTVAAVGLVQDGDLTRAALNVGGSVIVGLAAAMLGLYLGRILS